MEDIKNKLSLIRKYPNEIAILILAICVSYLFKLNSDLNDSFKNYIEKDHMEAIKVIERNTEALKTITNK